MFYFILAGLFASAFSSRLVSEQVAAYKKLLNNAERLTPEGFLTLAKYHDADSVCSGPCRRHLDKLLNGVEGRDWSYLEEILTEIYGGHISDDPYQPQEVHLALTGSPSEMKVIWATMEGLQDPFVEYTKATNDWTPETTKTVPASQYTYTVPENWYTVFTGVLYESNMVDLAVGKVQYKYRVGGFDSANNTIRRSKDFKFNSVPVTDPNAKTVFSMLADQGTFMVLGFSTTQKLIQVQDTLGVDIVMYSGDLCYAGLSGDLTPFNNVEEDDEFGHIWDLWGIQNEPVAATRPFMTGSGNHESFYNWTAFANRYKMPAENSGGNGNWWFSYNYGNVHIVAISTEHCVEAGCPQMVWLENDLANAVANRANVPWIIFHLHRPMYCSDDSASAVPGGTYQTALEPLMLKYDVDLVVQGHAHCYERIHPVNNGVVTAKPTKVRGESGLVDAYHTQGLGPVYVVQGNTGAMQVERWIQPAPEWSAVRYANGYIPPRNIPHPAELEGIILKSNYSDTFGIGVATFANSTHLHYSEIPVTGTIGNDEFWIIKRV